MSRLKNGRMRFVRTFPSGLFSDLFQKFAKTRISSDNGYQRPKPNYDNSGNKQDLLLPLLKLAPLALLPLLFLAASLGTSTTTDIVGDTVAITTSKRRKRRNVHLVS